jgi:hypothetical protein
MNSNNTFKKCILKNKQFSENVNVNGYVFAGNIGSELVLKIISVYEEHHKFLENSTGVFHTLYSNDLSYRIILNKVLSELLKPTYDILFKNYKIIANLIITKFPDQNSAFDIHQDTTSLNENAFTPLNVWIPLQDTSLENGCLCVVPKSQKFAYPYRGTSFKGQFEDVSNEIKPYLLPLKMKAGDILIFDNRMLHFSPPNTLKKPRVVMMSGIFQEEAEILTCFKKDEQSPIEIYKQNDDYLFTYKNFQSISTTSDSGIKIKELYIKPPISSKEDFLLLAEQHNLEIYNAFYTPIKNQLFVQKQPFLSTLFDKITMFLK